MASGQTSSRSRPISTHYNTGAHNVFDDDINRGEKRIHTVRRQRAEDPGASRAVCRRAGGGENGGGERAQRADVTGVGGARIPNGERRPGRKPAGQSLGADAPRAARPGRARRLRGFLRMLDGDFNKADLVGTVHDMRFVFLENDTKLLFATAYDGDWDAYIDDFAAKIPDYLDIISSAFEGWPGIRSPEVKDFFAKCQITAEGWYVANPDLTVAETRRLKRIGKAVDEFLDKINE